MTDKLTDRQARDFRMSKTVRDILRRIDNVFAAGGKAALAAGNHSGKSRTARQLWDVLSALRGPDSESSDDKQATTMIIRAASFPKTFDKGNSFISIPASFGYDEADKVTRRQEMCGSHHFRSHARKAFEVLGLDWSELNSPSTVNVASKPYPKRKTSKTKSARS